MVALLENPLEKCKNQGQQLKRIQKRIRPFAGQAFLSQRGNPLCTDKQERAWVDSPDANRSTAALPNICQTLSITFGWSLHSPGGGFVQEKKSATWLWFAPKESHRPHAQQMGGCPCQEATCCPLGGWCRRWPPCCLPWPARAGPLQVIGSARWCWLQHTDVVCVYYREKISG